MLLERCVPATCHSQQLRFFQVNKANEKVTCHTKFPCSWKGSWRSFWRTTFTFPSHWLLLCLFLSCVKQETQVQKLPWQCWLGSTILPRQERGQVHTSTQSKIPLTQSYRSGRLRSRLKTSPQTISSFPESFFSSSLQCTLSMVPILQAPSCTYF